jgi:hypothetical protein
MKLRDALLAQRVHEVLGQMTPVADAPIRAVARDGVVHLRGRVGSLQEARLAETVVAGLAGVRRVINELEVRPTPEQPVGANPSPETVFHPHITSTQDDGILEV